MTTRSRPDVWLRRAVVLLLSPIGLLLISATRLLIIADYNTTTATTIAASGGYLNTLLGTALPLIPIFLPYLAISLFLFKRFILSLLAFGAAILVSPTRLAPITALHTLEGDWNQATRFIEGHLLISILILFILLSVNVYLFGHFYGAARGLTLTLAIAGTAFLAPYVYFVYPFPHGPRYYETFMREPWLPAEQVKLHSGRDEIGYVLSSDIDWTVVLDARSRKIKYYRTEGVEGRTVCQLGPSNKISPLIRLLNKPKSQLPTCGTASPLIAPGPLHGRRVKHWAAKLIVTSNKHFRPLPGLTGLDICGSNQALALLKVELTGASAGFRVRVDRSTLMAPGAVRFRPTEKHDSFSLAFIRSMGNSAVSGHHIFDVEWRSPSGRPVELRHGAFTLQYRANPRHC
jgi:hypothetical protein